MLLSSYPRLGLWNADGELLRVLPRVLAHNFDLGSGNGGGISAVILAIHIVTKWSGDDDGFPIHTVCCAGTGHRCTLGYPSAYTACRSVMLHRTAIHQMPVSSELQIDEAGEHIVWFLLDMISARTNLCFPSGAWLTRLAHTLPKGLRQITILAAIVNPIVTVDNRHLLGYR